MWLEPAVAGVVALIGIALTSVGVLGHIGVAIAPGALLIFVGSAWLGNALARRDVRLLPAPRTPPESREA